MGLINALPVPREITEMLAMSKDAYTKLDKIDALEARLDRIVELLDELVGIQAEAHPQ